jgi:serine/threonine-protein kinase
VPDVVGMTQDAAVGAIQDAGLKAVVKSVASRSVPAGTVGAQFPSAGSQLPPGGEVLVAVSSGAAKESQSTTSQ